MNIDMDVAEALVEIEKEMHGHHHPQECKMVAVAHYLALIRMADFMHWQDNKSEDNPNPELSLDQQIDIVTDALSAVEGEEPMMMTFDETHAFLHAVWSIAYKVGKSQGIVEASTTAAILNYLVRTGQATQDEIDDLAIGDLDEERTKEIEDLSVIAGLELFGDSGLGKLFDDYNGDDQE